jgi:1-acyl-sn-glycerol-3-phosphate acyltransferase
LPSQGLHTLANHPRTRLRILPRVSAFLAALRLLAIAISIALLALCWLLRLPARLISARAATRLRERQMRTWARAVLALMNVRVERLGTPPPRPFFLVSNHLSYLDVLILWSQTPCSFLAKSEVARWPLLGPLTRAAGTLYVDRTRRSDVLPTLDAVRARLALDEGIVVFPEGTSSPGVTVLPFRSSLFEAAAATSGRVSLAAISYDTGDPARPAHQHVAWWGDMEFPGHFWSLLKLPRLRACVRFGEQPVTGADRKALARDAHAALLRIFEPTAPCPAAT